MYRLFIIGAGFSKPAGLPLGNELWKLVLEEARSTTTFYNLLISDINAYLNYQKIVYKKDIDIEDIDIEDLISYLDIEHFLELKGKDTFSEAGNRGQIILKVLIAKIIFQIQQIIPSEKLKLYDDFCLSLHETDIIISFNYDTLIEDSLKRVGKEYRLFPDRLKYENGSFFIDTEVEEVVLLKMHGSINWFDKTSYDKICDYRKENNVPDPYNVRGQIFSQPKLLDIKKLLKGEYFKDDPLQNLYIVNNLYEYFRTQILLFNPPLIISPSFSKMVYLNPIKSFWNSFNQAGAFNSSLNIIGFSFPIHDQYLMQPISRVIMNFQKYSQYNSMDVARMHKKHKLRVIDLQQGEQAEKQFKEKLSFINWDDTDFISDGFNKNAVDRIFCS